jgi:hypothetical protein
MGDGSGVGEFLHEPAGKVSPEGGADAVLVPGPARPQLYSVATDALVDRSLDDVAVAATVTEEWDKSGAGDRLKSDAAGYVYATNDEHNAVLRWASGSDGVRETVAHDSRLLWPDTLSLACDGRHRSGT